MAENGWALPLSFAQERLWFLDQMSPGMSTYNIGASIHVGAEIDPEILSASLHDLSARHETLRTSFAALDGHPVQVIQPDHAVQLNFIDVSGLSEPDRAAAIREAAETDALLPFQLESGPAWRFSLLRVNPSDHILQLTMHHIISDGWSLGVLFRELTAFYHARLHREASTLPELPVQYSDYALWQRSEMAHGAFAAQVQYWRPRLEGAPSLLQLPTDRVRPAVQSFRGACECISIGDSLTCALRGLSQSESATLFMTLLAAFCALLNRYTDQTDFCVGMPVAGRNRAELEGIIGFFANSLVFRADVSGHPSFRELLRRTKDISTEAYANADIPFNALVADLTPERGVNRMPLFQAMFGFQTATDRLHSSRTAGGPETGLGGFSATAKFDVTVNLSEYEDGLRGVWEYSTDLFDSSTMRRMSAQFVRVLEDVARDADKSVADLPSIASDEERFLAAGWESVSAPYLTKAAVHQLFEVQAAEHPEATAGSYGEIRINYGELNRRANRLARYLHLLGVQPDTCVGVCIEPSIEMLVSFLAILKAGAAYVPLDPEYPTSRLSFMIEDAGIGAVVAQKTCAAALPNNIEARILIDADSHAIDDCSPENLTVNVSGDTLAYVMYTSGSTGTPKGVCIPHRGITRLVWNTDYVQLDPTERIGQAASASFDASTFEIWGALLNGGQVVGIDKDTVLDPGRLGAFLATENITTLFITTALFNQVAAHNPRAFGCLRTVLVGGEAADPKWFREILNQAPPERLLHVYGPTENTTFSTWHLVDSVPESARTIPIGRPVANTCVLVTTASGGMAPRGIPGELWLGGAGLATGYLRQPELTAAKFIAHPLDRFSRMYRTGDRVRWREDGTLEFLGRMDNQVKVRGFRAEPGEVEAVLSRHTSVAQAVVVARPDTTGGQRFVAYAVPRTSEHLDEPGLRAWLSARLPPHLVPATFCVLDKLPVTQHGKIDRAALAADDRRGVGNAPSREPRDDRERALAKIWADILGVQRVGADDNFFALGGDSIQSIRIVARAREAGLKITPRQLFEHQTVGALAAVASVEAPEPGEEAASGPVPLTPIQHWFFEQNLFSSELFYHSVLVKPPGSLDGTALRTAIEEVMRHHDALRLRFSRGDAGWEQKIVAAEEEQPDITVCVIPDGPEHELRGLPRVRIAELGESLDLEHGPLVRWVLFAGGEGAPYAIGIIVHHLLVDGVSWQILLEDLFGAYSMAAGGCAVVLPPKTCSWRRWAKSLVKAAGNESVRRDSEYWPGLDWDRVKPLPRDISSELTINSVGSVAVVSVALDEETTRKLLREAPRAYHTQINDALLTGLFLAFARWRGSAPLFCDLESHGRHAPRSYLDTTRTIGWFTSMFPVLLNPPCSAHVGEVLRAVKEEMRRIPTNGLAYGLTRYLDPQSEAGRRIRAVPAAEVSFNYQGQFRGEDGDWYVEPLGLTRSPRALRAHLIEINGSVTAGQLRFTFAYSENVHHHATIQILADAFVDELCGLATHCASRESAAFTPSDFPLANLTRAELDGVIASHAPVSDIYALAPLQQGMLFHALYSQHSGEYVIQTVVTLPGDLQRAAFREAWQRIVNRHGVLRSSFASESVSEPVQVVHPHLTLPWADEDWRWMHSREREAHLNEYLRQDRLKGFDVQQAPLLRFLLVRWTDDSYRFIWVCHHLLIDGWSRPIILREVADVYSALRLGLVPQLPYARQFRDYIAWLRAQDVDAAERIWRCALHGFHTPTPLVVDQPDASAEGYGGLRVELPEDTSTEVDEFCKRLQLTLNTLVQGVWALLLSRYSGEDDIVFGGTVSGRPPDLPDVESMVGPFLNTLPVRVRVRPDMPVGLWLTQLQTQQADLRQYEFSPLVHIQRWSDSPPRSPLFESLLVFENYPLQEREGAGGALVAGPSEWTNYPLTLAVVPHRRLTFELTYSRKRFEAEAIRRQMNHLCTLLTSIIEDCEQMVAQVRMLARAEQRQLTLEFNARQSGGGIYEPVHHLFAKQAAERPEAHAVIWDGGKLTYRQLDENAEVLTCRLRREGARRGELIGICLDRSPSMTAALVAVLRAGGAYVPLDPTDPKGRVRWMIADSGIRLVVTERALAHILPAGPQLICMDETTETLGQPEPADGMTEVDKDGTAYVVYTSGSTGEPKGVIVTHESLTGTSIAVARHYALEPSDRVLQFAAPSFDVMAEEIYPTWLSGAAVVLRPAELPVHHLNEFISEHQISVVNLPSPYWHEWTSDMVRRTTRPPACLRLVIAGSDTVAPEQLVAWQRLVGRQVRWCNAYGLTETTITSTVYEPSNEEFGRTLRTVPIGCPLGDTDCYVVDSYGRLLPVGVPGELWIGGKTVARGYLGRPELTAERFTPNPFGPGRVYRTGDRVRWRADGVLEFLGRVDRQVKIRGYRVEIAEVEMALRKHASVDQVAVVVGPDQQCLIAYVAPRPGDQLSPDSVLSLVRSSLPPQLVPSNCIVLEHLPVNDNGKVDHAALAALNGVPRDDRKLIEARDKTERAVAEIWTEVLNRQRVYVHDNFFELGGHSLTAMRFVSRIRERFGIDLPIATVFEAPTVEQLARKLKANSRIAGSRRIPRRRGVGPWPTSYPQERLWFLDQLSPGTPTYNLPFVVRLDGYVELAAVQTAVDQIVARHESLRSTFSVADGRPVQNISAVMKNEVEFESVAGRTVSGADVTRMVDSFIACPFDLARGPLFRVKLVQLAHAEWLFVLVMHHVISDAWSLRNFTHEFESLYATALDGTPSTLPDLPVQYADYAVWQRKQIDSGALQGGREYWRSQLEGAPAALDLPTDRSRPPQQSFRGSARTLTLSAGLTRELRALSARSGATMFMTVLAGFEIFLHRLSGRDHLCVGSPVAGRNQVEVEGLIGLFLNNLVLRADLSGNPAFLDFLERTRATVLGAFGNQEVPFELLLEDLKAPRDPSRTPLFQVYFNYLNFVETLDLPGAVICKPHKGCNASEAAPAPAAQTSSMFDLTLYVADEEDALRLTMAYSTKLFDDERIAEMLNQFALLLSQIVENPEQHIRDYSLVTVSARQILPDPTEPLDAGWQGAVHELFSSWARRTPERVAVRDALGSWTYRRLDTASSGLAAFLQVGGVQPGDTVAIYAHRSACLACALLGIMKAGAAFTILDPLYPAVRLREILEMARPRAWVEMALTGSAPPLIEEFVGSGCSCRITLPASLDELEALLQNEGKPVPVQVGPNSPACVGFTSGSTGSPRGIIGRHGSLTHFLPWLSETFTLSGADRFSVLSGISHDPLQREIFTAVCLGATVCVPDPVTVSDPHRLASWMASEGITVAHMTPAFAQMLAPALNSSDKMPPIESLRLAFFVGDVLTRNDVGRLRQIAPSVKCVNYYGSTETQRAVGYHLVDHNEGSGVRIGTREVVPAGKGIKDVQILVLNSARALTGIGELGEIYMRSPHLAEGYLGDPALTRERFVENPFSAQANDRLYRTGDLGRYLPNGEVEFVGRADFQIKIRGFRVELGEIEATLARHAAVRDAAVIMREAPDGDKRLIAYVTTTDHVHATDLRHWLSERLPRYMVPSRFVTLSQMPVTPNGKLNRQALPEVPADETDLSGDPPRTELERYLASLWAELLGTPEPGVLDNFFALGGHSLLTIRLLSRIRAALHVNVPVRDFFVAPTVEALALAIEKARGSEPASDAPIARVPRERFRIRLLSDGRPDRTDLARVILQAGGGAK